MFRSETITTKQSETQSVEFNRGREIERHTYKQTHRQTDRDTDRERETERQTDRQRERHTRHREFKSHLSSLYLEC